MKIIVIIIFIFFSTTIYAGAWMQEKGHGLNVLTFNRYISTQFWTSSGNLQNSPTYAKNEIDEYIEFGLTEKFTIGLYLSGLQSHTSAAGTQTGSYDHMVFGRYQVWKSDWSVLSTQIFADKLGSGVAFNIPPNNTRFNTGEAILFGTGGRVKNQPWFFDSLFGFVQRYGAGDQMQLNLAAGLTVHRDKLLLLFQNFNTFSLHHRSHPQGSEYNLVTISPSFVLWITKKVGVQIGATQDVYGQNVGKGGSPFIASWIQF